MDKTLGVIFDMDGVLVDSEYAMREAGIRALRRYGVEASHEDFYEFTGMGEDSFIGGVARKHGLEYTLAIKELAYEIYVDECLELVILPPAVPDMLKALRAAGMFRLAVASSSDRVKVSANLKRIGVDDGFFDAVVTGSDITRKKPFPDIFLKAAGLIGVKPSRCIVLEDALSGLQAAKDAGMSRIGVCSFFDAETLSEKKPDYIISDMNEAYGKILEWADGR